MTLNSPRIICLAQSVLTVLHIWHHSEVYNIITKLGVRRDLLYVPACTSRLNSAVVF